MVATKPSKSKSHEQLAREWDKLARARQKQIAGGKDVSFLHVSVPTTLSLLRSADLRFVLEVGCGTGTFTSILSGVADRIVAVDPSSESIAIAKQVCADATNVEFVCSSLEDLSGTSHATQFTAAVALMSLMSTPSLPTFARSLERTLSSGASFVALFCHPWFWPRYWGYDAAPWFNYSRETFIEAPFTISNASTDIITTHIHRPLESYINCFAVAGFSLVEMSEPFPSENLNALYPSRWDVPRFLGMRWTKMRS